MKLLVSIPAGAELMIFLVICMLIVYLCFLITLQDTLRTVLPENRRIHPGLVWLMLVPVLGFIFAFVIVYSLANSIKADAKLKHIELGEKHPALTIGLAMCILNCLALIHSLQYLAGMASTICMFIYWSKISMYKKQLTISDLPMHQS